MQFKFSVEGLTALRADLVGMRDRMQDLQPAFVRSAIVALKAAKDRISSQGGGMWRATLEQDKGAPLHRNGRLINALTFGDSDNDFEQISGGYRVGTNIAYAGYVQEGTGIYGPRGTPITPQSGQYLVFTANGRQYFMRSVRGAPARPYLYIDDQVAEGVRAAFIRHITGKGASA